MRALSLFPSSSRVFRQLIPPPELDGSVRCARGCPFFFDSELVNNTWRGPVPARSAHEYVCVFRCLGFARARSLSLLLFCRNENKKKEKRRIRRIACTPLLDGGQTQQPKASHPFSPPTPAPPHPPSSSPPRERVVFLPPLAVVQRRT